MNIISNAVRYNKEKGVILLSYYETQVDDRHILFEFHCKDTGVGMSKEFQNHIFEPFTQETGGARSVYGGTGLGMPITKKLIEKMGGTIKFESEKNVGTTFMVQLPFLISADMKQAESQEDDVSIEGMRILLAEDNELNMEIAEFLLTNSQYYYMISSDGSDTLSVKIKKAANKGGEKIPEDAMWCDYGYSEEEEKPTEESIGLSLDEAKKLVKEKVEKMGITDLQFSNWNYAVCKSFEGDNSSGNFGNGYRIDYARTINGVPVTQTIADGGALEDMDSTMETWSYESLCFYVDKDGIESMTYSNPYTIGNIKTENLNLLSFSEIMKIYEKMMVVTNADNMQYENSRVYNIDRIVLGYARIYEPSTDAHTGILIPVWDFFGSMTSESEYNGETESNTSKDPNESFLTINAVDGSIIDRNLGY